jgi:hypothetical protein
LHACGAGSLFGDKGDTRYVLSQHPDLAVLRVRDCESQPDRSPQGIDGKIYAEKEFQNHFERLSCWNFDPDCYHLLLFGTKPMQSGAINSAVSRAWWKPNRAQ